MKNLAWLGAFSLLLAACAPQQTRPLAEAGIIVMECAIPMSKISE